jgi:hypothetical protein
LFNKKVIPDSFIEFWFRRTLLCVINESVSPVSLSNLGQGKSLHSPQTSKPFFLTQHVIKEQEGCLFSKSKPYQPGHFEEPSV